MKILRERYPSWKLVMEWNILSAHQEFRVQRDSWKENLENEPEFRRGDVVWVITKRDKKFGKLCKDAILHEVKTGHFDINEIFHKYQNYHTPYGSVAGHTYLWIWGWREKLIEQLPDREVRRKMRYGGYIRLLPLEIIFPLVKRKISELGLCDDS